MLRAAEAADVNALWEIERLSFSSPWSKAALEETLLESLRGNCVAVIVAQDENEEIKGFIIYSLVQGEAEIYDIAVSPIFRRKGVGEAMIKAVLENCRRGFLEVRESNLPARELYKKMGFKAAGVRKKYYSDGENAVVMVYERTCGNGTDIGD